MVTENAPLKGTFLVQEDLRGWEKPVLAGTPTEKATDSTLVTAKSLSTIKMMMKWGWRTKDGDGGWHDGEAGRWGPGDMKEKRERSEREWRGWRRDGRGCGEERKGGLSGRGFGEEWWFLGGRLCGRA